MFGRVPFHLRSHASMIGYLTDLFILVSEPGVVGKDRAVRASEAKTAKVSFRKTSNMIKIIYKAYK